MTSPGSDQVLFQKADAYERFMGRYSRPLAHEFARATGVAGLLGPRSRWRSAIVPKPSPPDSRVAVDTRAPRRWPWARLLQRVFGFDVLVCDRCGGRRRILGAVTEPHAVRRLLAALGLAPEPPPGRPAPAA
jgi:hypothetical protein